MNAPANYFPRHNRMGVLVGCGPRARCLTRTAGAGILSVPSVVCCRGKSTAGFNLLPTGSRRQIRPMNHAEGTEL
jgi:hypothetical protein